MAENDTANTWFSAEVATFGDRLAGAREAAGLSQHDLAKRLGVRLTTVQAWEDDASEPRSNRLQMLAGMLNVSIRWLLTGEGDGLDAPSAPGTHDAATIEALSDLARMRAQMLALAQDLGQMETRLHHLMRREEVDAE
ncbi:helix-turn-helix domain-containing protein [Pseudotabrizicola sp.]|uniref:helix-turn-helix domain-containing protein n=1 Tax=Pseudotabrizicola sp. TaxID=2939647 RepID=UPI00271DA641|nr:helix-turn-helix domain-containing protein [Pseudotabrizicola sp.]MDO8882818.1 helix-turn-helix domain-containing protein [Pseudotabrizicola sp.]